MDEAGAEVTADDADALADAIEDDFGDEMAELIAFLRDGSGFRVVDAE
jgi:hypothetical protein